jgi:hypothetical protein
MGYIRNGIIADLEDELARAHAKHGTQSLPLGTRDGGMNLVVRAQAQLTCDRHTREGTLTWEDIIAEERAEAACEQDYERWRAETIQEAAMCIKAIQDMDEKCLRAGGVIPTAKKPARAATKAAVAKKLAKRAPGINRRVNLGKQCPHSDRCPTWCGWQYPGHDNDPHPPAGAIFYLQTTKDGFERAFSLHHPNKPDGIPYYGGNPPTSFGGRLGRP